jgi:hypothetical protein
VGHRVVRCGGDHRTDAVAREQFEQERPVDVTADQVRATHPVANGLDRAVERAFTIPVERVVGQGVGIGGAQLAYESAVRIAQALAVDQTDQLVGSQRCRDLACDLPVGQVEDLPGRRVADGREHHDRTVAELANDGVGVDPSDRAGMAEIDAITHAEGTGGDEVPGDHAHPGPSHGRVGHAHREQRLEFDTHRPGSVLDAAQCQRVGDTQSGVVVRFDVACRETLLDLWTDAVHQHDADAERAEQGNVVHECGEPVVLDRLARKRDDERPATVGMDVRR